MAKKISAETKSQGLKMLEQGMPAMQIAAELGVSRGTVAVWKREPAKNGSELDKLRALNAKLQDRLEIFKEMLLEAIKQRG